MVKGLSLAEFIGGVAVFARFVDKLRAELLLVNTGVTADTKPLLGCVKLIDLFAISNVATVAALGFVRAC